MSFFYLFFVSFSRASKFCTKRSFETHMVGHVCSTCGLPTDTIAPLDLCSLVSLFFFFITSQPCRLRLVVSMSRAIDCECKKKIIQRTRTPVYPIPKHTTKKKKIPETRLVTILIILSELLQHRNKTQMINRRVPSPLIRLLDWIRQLFFFCFNRIADFFIIAGISRS